MTTPQKKQPIVFGPYLLLDRVNIGGMAEVWRAKVFGAGGFERLLAIKRILPNIAEDPEFIEMFIDEAKITVLLTHANIAQVHDMNSLQGSYYIAMEYVAGKDLRAVFDRCRKRGEPAPLALTCSVVAQCCDGLDYAHRARDKQGREMHIVHRDVSPQNALISYEGEVKVIDFGIAKAAGKINKTQAGILKGKFGYMSPEQIRGEPLDRRSDVFAVGVCLYELLTGERLFVGDSDFSVLEKVRKVEVLPPSHFNRRIPERLERIVMRALARDVDERYQYALDLAEDLRAFQYSTGNVFSRKDLSAFMRATFAEDYEKERERAVEYSQVKAPEGMLAALAAGQAVGAIPAPGAEAASPSAVTAVPLVHALGSQGATAAGLPPIARPPAPGGAAGRPGPPPSLAPRLTPARPAPLPGAPAPTATQPLVRALVAEEPTHPGVERGARPPGPWDGVTDPLRPAHVPSRPEAFGPGTEAAPREAPAPLPRPGAVTAAQVAHQANTRLALVLGGIVALLGLGLLAVVLLKPPATGVVIIAGAPEEVRGQLVVQINGETRTEPDGSPITHWPSVQRVRVGKATVQLLAPGYEPLLEVVEVSEGTPVQLTTPMQKSR